MRPEKTAIVAEIRGRLERADYALLAAYHGLSVERMSGLRELLRKHHAEVHVVKNSYLGVAASQLGLSGLDGLLTGSTALVTGAGDLCEAAKLLAGFAKDNPLFAVKGGLLDGAVFTAADVETLTKLPPRQVLLAMAVGTIAAPMTRLVGAMSQKLCSLLYVLRAIEEKKGGAQAA